MAADPVLRAQVDFHAMRTAYVTLVDENGASWKETRTLARHTSLQVTERYARTRNPRLNGIVEAIGACVLDNKPISRDARSVHHSDAAPEERGLLHTDNASLNLLEASSLRAQVTENESLKRSGGGGNRTRVP